MVSRAPRRFIAVLFAVLFLVTPVLATAEILDTTVTPSIAKSDGPSYLNVGINWSHVTRDDNESITRLLRSYPTAPVRNRVTISADDARNIALNFIEVHSGSLSNITVSDVDVVSVDVHGYTHPKLIHRGNDHTVTLRLLHHGVPAFAPLSSISMNQYGEIYAVNMYGYIDPTTPYSPTVSSVAVLESIYESNSVQGADLLHEPRLMILPPDRVIWRVQCGDPINKEYAVDATTGAVVIERSNLLRQAPEGMCWIHGRTEGSRDGTTDPYVSIEGVPVVITEENGIWPDIERWSGQSNASGDYNLDEQFFIDIMNGDDPAELFVSAVLDNTRVEVEEHRPLQINPPVSVVSDHFTPQDEEEIDVGLRFDSDVGQEGSCAFVEIQRGWECTWSHTYKDDKVTVIVHSDDWPHDSPQTDGVNIYLPPNRATLPGDTMLHEFAHTYMYERYGDQFPSGNTQGRVGQCPNNCSSCDNHGGSSNECSADAIVEGWAAFFPVAVYDTNPAPDNPADSSYDYSNNTFPTHPLEDNSFGSNDGGQKLEWAVGGILWDLYDPIHSSDNDRVSLGGNEVWEIMMIRRPYTTKELYEICYQVYEPLREEIWEVFNNHGIEDQDAITESPAGLVPAAGAAYESGQSIPCSWSTVNDTNMGDLNQSIASGSLYDVEIASDVGFSNIVASGETITNTFIADLPTGDYHIRVRAKDYAGNAPGPWSSPNAFSIEDLIGIATMDFEDGIDGAVISSTIPGMFFTTTQGYDWLYGDVRTGNYNVDPYGQYVCNGDFFAWLGPNQGMGRIDFTGATARSISLLTSTYTGLYLDAFDAQGNLIDQDYTPGNLGSYQLSPLSVSGDGIAYMLIHDGGNYWLIDDLQVEDLLRTTEQMMGSSYSVGTEALDLINQGLTAVYNFMNNGSSSFQVILNWGGSEFRITAYMPNGEVYDQWQSDQPPLISIIDQPMNGEWTFEVTAIDVPNNDYPFAFVLGVTEPDPDTTPPLITALSPAPGATFALYEEVMFTFEAQDPESGIMDLVGLVDLATELESGQSIGFDTPGEHEIQITAVNYVGLSTTETITFNVTDIHTGCLWTDATTGPLGDTVDGHGVSWGDFDGDDDDDLFLANNGANRLLRNDGDGNFVKLDMVLGGYGDSRVGCWGDYDDDGDLDLYIVNYNAANVLYRNDDGVFTDVTDGPLGDIDQNTSGSWADWDLDGDIDLYLTTDDGWSKLLRNDNGAFVEVIGDPASFEGWSRGCAWGDYDNDGDQDLYVTGKDGPNKLFRNDLGAGFVDVSAPPVDDPGSGKGCAWGDYDNNGWLDLYVVNKDGANKLFHNDGGVFADVTDAVTGDEGDGRTCVWGDYDNDGWLDLFLTNVDGNNRLFQNLQGLGFADTTCGDLATAELTAWGAAFADDDLDGDLDLYVSNHTWQGVPNRMFRNGLIGGKWLAVDLVGTTSNRYGLGARVELTAGGTTQIRQVAPAGYLIQAPTTCYFGLGDASTATLTVTWPTGVVREVPVLAVNTRLEVVETTSTAVETPQNDLAFRISNRPNPFNPSTTISFTLPEAAEVRLQIFDVSGRLIKTLVSGEPRGIGDHHEIWNGRAGDGSSAPSGLYFYRIVAGKHQATQRMTLVK